MLLKSSGLVFKIYEEKLDKNKKYVSYIVDRFATKEQRKILDRKK